MTRSPIDHLTPTTSRLSARELDAIREQVIADAASATPTTSATSSTQRKLELEAAPRCCSRCSRRPGWPARPACRCAKIIENMEIGHNVMHGQWDWMRDPEIHSSTWEWDNASTVRHVEALAQLHAPQVHQRPRQGRRPRLRHPARRPRSAVASLLPRPAAVYNLATGCVLRMRRRPARPRTRHPQRQTQGRGPPPGRASTCCAKIGRQIVKDYVLCPALSGPSAVDRRYRPNSTANLIRNVWTHAVIFCGHFPDGAQTFDARRPARRRDPRRLVPAPDARLGQHRPAAGCCTS